MSRRFVRFAGVMVVAVALAACSSSASPSPSPSVMASVMPMGSGAMGDEIDALGEPGDAAQASRTIHITANDQLKFDPATASVEVGETVTFEIENTGSADHEFVLGSAAFQESHEQEMMDSPGMQMDEPNEVMVPAGQTESLTWQFTEAGSVEYGCHEPGHFAAGMVGTITVG